MTPFLLSILPAGNMLLHAVEMVIKPAGMYEAAREKGKQTNQYRNQFSVETYTMTHTMLRAPLINYGSFGTICSSRSPYTVGAVGWPGLPQSWRSGKW